MMDQYKSERERARAVWALLYKHYFKKHSLRSKTGCKVERGFFAARRKRRFLIYRAKTVVPGKKKIWPYV
jgi:hypothetical protein